MTDDESQELSPIELRAERLRATARTVHDRGQPMLARLLVLLGTAALDPTTVEAVDAAAHELLNMQYVPVVRDGSGQLPDDVVWLTAVVGTPMGDSVAEALISRGTVTRREVGPTQEQMVRGGAVLAQLVDVARGRARTYGRQAERDGVELDDVDRGEYAAHTEERPAAVLVQRDGSLLSTDLSVLLDERGTLAGEAVLSGERPATPTPATGAAREYAVRLLTRSLRGAADLVEAGATVPEALRTVASAVEVDEWGAGRG